MTDPKDCKHPSREVKVRQGHGYCLECRLEVDWFALLLDRIDALEADIRKLRTAKRKAAAKRKKVPRRRARKASTAGGRGLDGTHRGQGTVSGSDSNPAGQV